MADIFISYKSERRKAAEHLAEILTDWGFSVWWDYALAAGENFPRVIESELQTAKAVIVLWCPLAVRSDWVIREATYAQNNGKKLVPAQIDHVTPPLEFTGLQMIDLSAWDGDPRSAPLRRLLRDLALRVGREPRANEEGLDRTERAWRRFGARSLRDFALEPPIEPTPGAPRTRPAQPAQQAQQAPQPASRPAGPSSMAAFLEVPRGPCLQGFQPDQIRLTERLVKSRYPQLNAERVAAFMKETLNAKPDVPAFRIGATPVTNAAFDEFVSATGYMTTSEKERGQPSWRELRDHADHPVVYVTWHDAMAYCRWSQSTLPTIEQWVRAFRGDDYRLYPWGDTFDPSKCNTTENRDAEHTTPARHYEAGKSPFGCYDMVGNVEEWTSSSRNGYYALLGGSYAHFCAVEGLPAPNLHSHPSQLYSNRGFRCARAIDSTP